MNLLRSIFQIILKVIKVYKPDEVYKLEHAIVLREGKYVIVGVSSSYDDLETSIKSYLK